MIPQANILDRMTRSVRSASTAVILTHNIDFLFVESVVVPQLRRLGHPQLTIFADAACAAGAYWTQRGLLNGLGRRYRVVAVDLGPGRRFHPKALFIAGADGSALAVGSGNLTHGGWGANCEIWEDFAFPGEGGPAISAFRDYLQRILELLPAAEPVGRAVSAGFTEMGWASDLPGPGVLLGTPGDGPLLGRMIMMAGAGLRGVDVVTPYFDPEGAALATLAKDSGAAVRAYLQRGRAGLCNAAAQTLPPQVTLATVDGAAPTPRSFLHAKVFAFRRDSTALLAIGSANCSRAALLSDETWGNAELVAVRDVNLEVVDEILGHLNVSDDPPILPAQPPNAEWAVEAAALRILSARRDGHRLEINFKGVHGLADFSITSSASPSPMRALSQGEALAVDVSGPVEWVSLHARTVDGSAVASEPMWVDDERALRLAGPQRRLRERLDDGIGTRLHAHDYLELLELFDVHVRQPIAGGPSRPTTQPTSHKQTYTAEEVFAADFGRAPPRADSARFREFADGDTWALFASFFNIEDEVDRSSAAINVEPGDDEEDASAARPKAPPVPADMSKKVLRVLGRIEQALSAPAFVRERPAARLAADIGFTALLLAKASKDGFLSAEETRGLTSRMWQSLFFGQDGHTGSIPERVANLAPDQHDDFVAELSSPRLSAAMAVWCAMEWHRDDPASSWFRLSAALLAARIPWIVSSGSPEAIRAELSRIFEAGITMDTPEQNLAVWVEWLRSGVAVISFERALEGRNAKELAAMCTRPQLPAGELLWQAGELCILSEACGRQSGNAEVHPLGRTETRRFKTPWLVPVADLLASDLGLPSLALRYVANLIRPLATAPREHHPSIPGILAARRRAPSFTTAAVD